MTEEEDKGNQGGGGVDTFIEMKEVDESVNQESWFDNAVKNYCDDVESEDPPYATSSGAEAPNDTTSAEDNTNNKGVNERAEVVERKVNETLNNEVENGCSIDGTDIPNDTPNTASPPNSPDSAMPCGNQREGPRAGARRRRHTRVELQRENASVILFKEVVGTEYRKRFWVGLLFSSVLQGVILGFIALGFFHAVDGIAEATWLSEEYERGLDIIIAKGGGDVDQASDGQTESIDLASIGTGKWWWVAMLTAAGFVVGLTKTVWSCLVAPRFESVKTFPTHVPGFIEELGHLRLHDPATSIAIFICSLLSVGFGAGVGPEAPMGAIGTAVGTIFPSLWKGHTLTNYFQSTEEAEMCSLDGKAAGLAATFPSQFLSPLIIHEVGEHWGSKGKPGKFDFMETVTRTGVAASVSAAIFLTFDGMVFLQPVVFNNEETTTDTSLEIRNLGICVLLGWACGLLGMTGQMFLILGDAAGQHVTVVLNNLGNKLISSQNHVVDGEGEHRHSFRLGQLLAPAIGGSLVGLLTVAFPLSIGDGASQLHAVALGDFGDNGTGTLYATSFAVLIELSIAQGFGFVGGQIFPFLFSGATFGAAISDMVPKLHKIVVVTSCMAAVPSAFIPALFSFTTLSSLVFNLSGPDSTPVFICALCSYATVTGTGLLKNVMLHQIAKLESKPTIAIRRSLQVFLASDDSDFIDSVH